MKRTLFISLLLLIQACQITRTNDKKDVADAKQIVEEFYQLLKSGNKISASALFSGAATPEGAMHTFAQTDSIMGSLISYKVRDIETTTTVKGEKKTGKYIITIDSQYDKGYLEEELVIIVQNEKYYFDGYNLTKAVDQ